MEKFIQYNSEPIKVKKKTIQKDTKVKSKKKKPIKKDTKVKSKKKKTIKKDTKVKSKKKKPTKNAKKVKSSNKNLKSVNDNINRYLSERGYVIRKKSLKDRELMELKNKLTVKPNIPRHFATFVKSFPVFLENKNKIYIPKQYGIDKFGIPEESRLSKGKLIKLKFNGDMREKQLPVINAFIKSCNLDTESKKKRKSKKSKTIKESKIISGGGIVAIPCGYGKCLGKNTPVLMYNGTIKKVQDIIVGDKLMGDDSRIRNVLSVCKGRDQLFKIHQQHGDSYVVNRPHILSLYKKEDSDFKYFENFKKIDMELEDFRKEQMDNYYGYSSTINFSKRPIYKDPYVFGTDIGKWFKNIIELSKKIEDGHDILLHSNMKRHIDILNKYKINDIIPYFVNSYLVRNNFLAGFIDIIGTARTYSCFIWITIEKNIPKIVKDSFQSVIDLILRIAKSVGLCTKIVSVTSVLHKILIYGKKLISLPYKKIQIGMSKKSTHKVSLYRNKNILSKLSIENLGEGEYYGFEIDCNRRFMLGDCTVTHNTVCALNIITRIRRKTLIIVHKEFLMDQWKERISQFLPEARVGIIQQKTVDIRNKDIVLAMLQSLSIKKFPKKQSYYKSFCMARQLTDPNRQCSRVRLEDSEYCKKHKTYSNQRIDEDLSFDSFGFCIVDECHHIAAEVFSKALRKVTCPYMLGLSATPNRTDGLSKVFKWYMGPIVYQIKQRHKEEVYVKCVEINSDSEPYSKVVLNYMRKPVLPTMITNICEYSKRTLLVALLIKKCFDVNRRVLVLSDRRGHLESIFSLLNEIGIDSVGFYMGGMKKEVLKESLKCQILLGTYTMVSEGFDHPELDTIVMASPKSNIEQSVGRILRKKHEVLKPLVVDITDTFSCFMNQANKRRRFYKKSLYPYSVFQIHDNSDDDDDKEWIRQIDKIVLEPSEKDRKESLLLQEQKILLEKNKKKEKKKGKKNVCLIDDD